MYIDLQVLMLFKGVRTKQTGMLVFIGQIALSFEQCRRQLTKFLLRSIFPADSVSSFIMFFLHTDYNAVPYNQVNFIICNR